jgi:hypothetical protein
MKLQNKPGEPIVTREQNAIFYCASCGGTYARHATLRRTLNLPPQCKCRVYVSTDTIKRANHTISAPAMGQLEVNGETPIP